MARAGAESCVGAGQVLRASRLYSLLRWQLDPSASIGLPEGNRGYGSSAGVDCMGRVRPLFLRRWFIPME